MGINVNFDPTDPFGSKADKRYNQSVARTEEQRYKDNIFRERMFREDQRRYQTANRQHLNRITLLKKDARNAGVSLMAALGSPGTSPAHITMPAGQGGRAMGNYQRKSPLEVSANMNASNMLGLLKQKAEVDNIEANTQAANAVTANKQLRTITELQKSDPVKVEGTMNQAVSATTKRYRTNDGGMMRGPAEDFPDPEQALFWWIQDKYFQLKAKETHPYHSELSRKHRKKGKRLTRRGYR